MKKGIIYLIQPPNLLNTNQYKIGCLRNHDINVLEGSRIICMIECDNQYKVKYYIKEDMTNKFNGGIIIIRYDFLELVNKYSEYSYIDKEKEDIIDQITTYEDYIIVPKGRIRPFRAKTSKISDIIITDSKYLIEKDNIWTEFNRINPLLYFLEINFLILK
jgi:hypothetical protein